MSVGLKKSFEFCLYLTAHSEVRIAIFNIKLVVVDVVCCHFFALDTHAAR